MRARRASASSRPQAYLNSLGDARAGRTACRTPTWNGARPSSGPTSGRPSSRSSGTCAAPRRTRSPRRASRPPGPRSSSPSRARSTTASEHDRVGRAGLLVRRRRGGRRRRSPRCRRGSRPTSRSAEAAELGLQLLDAPRHSRPSGPALEAWYNEHAGEFDTTCVSFIVTADPETADDRRGERSRRGLSFADGREDVLEGHDDRRPRAARIGCYLADVAVVVPVVQHYVGSVATGHVSDTSPSRPARAPTATYLFLATKRTPNVFETIHAAVASLRRVEQHAARPSSWRASIQLHARRHGEPRARHVGSRPRAAARSSAPPAPPPSARSSTPAANTPVT